MFSVEINLFAFSDELLKNILIGFNKCFASRINLYV